MSEESRILKLASKLDSDFTTEANSMADDKVKDMIVNLSKQVEDLQEQKKNDSQIKVLAEDLKDLRGGYTDLIKPLKQKTQYLLLLLEDRGKL